jgi:Zinc finger, ZZ type
VRVIDDSDDDGQRFSNNLFNLQGRAKRASTKMVRIDDSSSSASFYRSDTVNTQFTQVKRIDTGARESYDDFEEAKKVNQSHEEEQKVEKHSQQHVHSENPNLNDPLEPILESNPSAES